MTRVAFTPIGGPQWLGGLNYLRNLFKVLKHFGNGSVEPVLFVEPDFDLELLNEKGGVVAGEVVRSEAFRPAALRRRALHALAMGHDPVSEDVFAIAGIDAIFESSTYFGWRPKTPVLSWYPDFQHRHLPHMFTRWDILQRDMLLHARMFGPRIFMLSSKAAETDCITFYPRSKGRTTTVPFAVVPPVAPSVPDETTYALVDRYILLPNQFWQHKNHNVVVEALALLKDDPSILPIIVTGLQADARRPGYYPMLQQKLETADLGDRFRMLGVVPYVRLTTLMRGATAMLNPSLFEGWSTTVEEAKAVGVPLLLSDIPVHHEQAHYAAFFPPHSPEQLAAQLREISAAAGPIDSARRQAIAWPAQQAQLHRFADAFRDAVDLAVRHHASARHRRSA